MVGMFSIFAATALLVSMVTMELNHSQSFSIGSVFLWDRSVVDVIACLRPQPEPREPFFFSHDT